MKSIRAIKSDRAMKSRRSLPVSLAGIGAVLLVAGIAWYAFRTAEAQNVPSISIRGTANSEFSLAYAEMFDKDICETVVYNTSTGQSWLRNGTAWNKIVESGQMPAGKYQITLVPSHQGGYRSFRLDQNTGKTWYIQDQKWVPFEPLAP